MNELPPSACKPDWVVGSSAMIHPTVGNGRMGCVAFSPNGKLLATGDYERGTIALFNVSSGERLQFIRNDDQGQLNRISFSPDSRWLVSHPWGRPWRENVVAWDVETGDRVAWEALEHANNIAFNVAANECALAYQNRIEIWSLKDLSLVEEFAISSPHYVANFSLSERCCVFTHDWLEVWHRPSGRLHSWQFSEDGESFHIESLANSVDHKWLAVLAGGEPVKAKQPPTRPGSASKLQLQLHRLNLVNMRWDSRPFARRDYTTALHVTLNGEVLATVHRSSNARDLKIHSFKRKNSRTRVLKGVGGYSGSPVVSRNGQRVFVFNRRADDAWRDEINWVNLSNGAIEKTISGIRMPQAMTLSPDESLLAVACRDGANVIFHCETGENLHEISGSRTELSRFAIDDSQNLAFVTNQTTLRIHDLQSSTESIVEGEFDYEAEIFPLTNGDCVVSHLETNNLRNALISRVSRSDRKTIWRRAFPNSSFESFAEHDGRLILIDRNHRVDRAIDLHSGEPLHAAPLPVTSADYPYYVRATGLGVAEIVPTDEGLLIQHDQFSHRLVWPEDFSLAGAWLPEGSIVLDPTVSHLVCCFSVNENDVVHYHIAKWNLNSPDQVQSLKPPAYYEDWGFQLAISLNRHGRWRVAFLRASENTYEDEPYKDFVVMDLATNDVLFEYPEIDRFEFGLPFYGMKAAFSNHGEKVGLAINNRLLIWSLPD